MIDQVHQIKKLVKSRNSSQCRVMAVSSGKGGVGKTNLAINLGMALAQQDKKVVIVDTDTKLANVDILLGLSPKNNLIHFVLDDMPLEKIVIEHESGVHIVPGSSGNSSWKDIDSALKARLLEMMFKLRSLYDFVILDTEAGISALSLHIAAQADQILMVTTPEPTAITDAYAMIKVFDSLRKDTPIDLLLNMVTVTSEVFDVYQRLSLVVEHFLGIHLGIVGYIEMDEHVRRAVKQQQPFFSLYPESTAAANLQTVAETILNQKLAMADATSAA
jgi:flagellar biosynthesis protein FlhG